MVWDGTLFYALNSLTGWSDSTDSLIVFFAAVAPCIIVAVFLYFLFVYVHPKRERWYVGWTVALTIIIARFGVVELVHTLYHRPRPFLVLTGHTLLSDGWFYADNTWSFPSAHATIFFAMATVVYLHNKQWGMAFFAAAVVVSVSRVIAGVHYPSDIVAGMIVGVAVAVVVNYYVTRRFRFPHTR